MKRVVLFLGILILSGCANYPGEKLISLTDLPTKTENQSNLSEVEDSVNRLYKLLMLPENRQIPFGEISNYELVQDDRDMVFSHERNKVFLIKGNVSIGYCRNSIVIATGDISISHGSNNIVFSGKNISIGHDRARSIVIAKNSVEISFAYNTTLYAPGGVKVSHQNNVISYNTDKRETSWGHINNIVVDPLFKKENTFNKNSQQDAAKDAAPCCKR